MFTNQELIEQLEVDVKTAKAASMLAKPKAIETSVDSLVVVIKAQELAINKLASLLIEVKQELTTHRRTGK